jgi:hypothetical protein
MSKLKAWHILVPTLIIAIAAPVATGFASVKKQKEEVARLKGEIETAQDKAAQLEVRKAELQQAQYETAVVAKELSQIKNAKLPVWSGNSWWRQIRQGGALTPGPASIRVGESGSVVNLPDGVPAMFDVWFLLREDLGVALRDYFDATGVQVDYDLNLPTPRVAPYSTTDLLIQVPITNVRVRGPYKDVLRFFRRLGDAPLLIAVTGPVSIRPVDGTAGAEITATTDLNVMIFPNLPPDKMADLLALLASAGGASAAAPAGGGMGPMGPGMGPGMGAGMGPGPGMPGRPGGPGGSGGSGGPSAAAPAR